MKFNFIFNIFPGIDGVNTRTAALITLVFAFTVAPRAQESPYFVAYDHHLEEPGHLEIAVNSSVGVPRKGNPAFFAPYTELEYGVKAWWTSELYLEGQSTRRDSTIFTGWRLENRFRPLAREHVVNPVLYLEYEDLNEGSRIQKEIVGHAASFKERNSVLRHERARELEGRLILSSNFQNWNISENFIVEKNFSADEGMEFGYALGIARPLAALAASSPCRFCRENVVAGMEVFGGLGSSLDFGLRDTAHYLAPTLSWQVSDNSSLRFSPAVGLTSSSLPLLLRFGYSYEVRGFGNRLADFFHGKQKPRGEN